MTPAEFKSKSSSKLSVVDPRRRTCGQWERPLKRIGNNDYDDDNDNDNNNKMLF